MRVGGLFCVFRCYGRIPAHTSCTCHKRCHTLEVPETHQNRFSATIGTGDVVSCTGEGGPRPFANLAGFRAKKRVAKETTTRWAEHGGEKGQRRAVARVAGVREGEQPEEAKGETSPGYLGV